MQIDVLSQSREVDLSEVPGKKKCKKQCGNRMRHGHEFCLEAFKTELKVEVHQNLLGKLFFKEEIKTQSV